MKCDEQQPICRNCIKSKRECKRGIRLNFTLMTVSGASLDPPSLVRKRPSKASETSDHYTHIFPRTHRYHFLDQSITIASLYEDGMAPYEPYLHLHRHEDLCESDRQFQEDTMCLWSSAGLVDRSAATLLPLPLSGKLCVSARSRANLSLANLDVQALQSLMVPDYSMMAALRYLTLFNGCLPLGQHSQVHPQMPQSQLPLPHPPSHQLNNYIQPSQHFSASTLPLSGYQYPANPLSNEVMIRDNRIKRPVSSTIFDLNSSSESMRGPVMTRSSPRNVRYESSASSFMQKGALSTLNDLGKELGLSVFDSTAQTETFDFMMGNDSYAMNPALSNFFGAEVPVFSTPSNAGQLLQRPPQPQYSSGYPGNISSASFGCDSRIPEPETAEGMNHNTRLCTSPQLPMIPEHTTIPEISPRRISDGPTNGAHHSHQELPEDQCVGIFCQPSTSVSPSHLHSPNVIKFCNLVSQNDIIRCMDLIENEQYYWLLDLFNGMNIWKTMVPSYCVDDQKDRNKSMFLLRCLLNCSAQSEVTTALPALTLEQQSLWNLIRHDTSCLNSAVPILEELILSVALILLSLYGKSNIKCTSYIKVVFNNQAKLFEALTYRLGNSSESKKSTTLLVASGIQLVVILKYMIRRRFGLCIDHPIDGVAQSSITNERNSQGPRLVPAYMPLSSIKEHARGASSHDTFEGSSMSGPQRYQSTVATSSTALVAFSTPQNHNTDDSIDCKIPDLKTDLQYLNPHCCDQGEEMNVSLADFLHVGECERQGLDLLFADLEYVYAETIEANSPTQTSNEIEESRELRHYFWNMIKSEAMRPNYDEAYMPMTHSSWPQREHELRFGATDITGVFNGQASINERLALINLITEKLRKITMRGESMRACDTRIKYIFKCIWESLLSEGAKKRWVRDFGWMRD